MNMPHEAKSSKSKIFEKYFDDVFDKKNKELPKQLLISYKLLTFVEKQTIAQRKQMKNGDTFLYHADLALVYMAGKIYPKIKEDEELFYNDILLNDMYELEVVILRTTTQLENKIDEDYSHNKFFKSRHFKEVIERMSNGFLAAAVDEILSRKQDAPLTDINVLAEKIAQSIREYYRNLFNNL